VKKLRLSAVRLVGIHNYEDVLVRVRGDLFVVGTNESGKTTLLDAVHLALSGDQDLDWNAAASIGGQRRSGRTLQGVILRADMAGQSTRPGGSISYAVVELEAVEGNSEPMSLVFGASAMDMHTQVHKWGAVVNRRAADLPLTQPQPDGKQRIIDRDEFESCLGHRASKGSRGLGDYRAAVANRLFKGREDFDQITRLWRTAKSYRDIASTARNMGEVIREVLPAPEPAPFQKIAKGFRDITGIETDLYELSNDVNALYKLRALLEETRETRETVRRHVFMKEMWRVRDMEAQRDQKRKQLEAAKACVEELQREIARHDEQNSLIKQRLGVLRESDNFKLLTSVEAKEQELQRYETRIIELEIKLREEHGRFLTLREDCDNKRTTADYALTHARERVGAVYERFKERPQDGPQDLINEIQRLAAHLPSYLEERLDENAIRNCCDLVRKQIDNSISRVDQRIIDGDQKSERLKDEVKDATDQLGRIDQFEDLVPSVPGLDVVLIRLKREGIVYTLLFQHLEWQAAVTYELRSAIEAALGLARLGTIIVSPQQTETAQKIILEAGGGLRVLDANIVDFTPCIDAQGETRLLDFLKIQEPRVHAHLEATIGAVFLYSEMPADGTDTVWFVENGTGGERGVRWRLALNEPLWIDERHRQDIRQQERERLLQVNQSIQERKTAVDKDLALWRSTRQGLSDGRVELEQLGLPWSIIQSINDWRHASETAAQSSRLISDRTAELDGVVRQRDEASQIVAAMRTQIEGTAAAVLKKQIDELEQQKTDLERPRIEGLAKLQVCQGDILSLNEQIATCESKCGEGRRALGVARASLTAVLLPEQTRELDHYVFETKRGNNLKDDDLDDEIVKAREKEIELRTRLGGADGVMSDKLAIRYSFRLEDDEAQLVIRDRSNQDLDSILEERRDHERQMRESLNEKSCDLFETILARDLIERLRADLLQLQRTLIEMNRKLEPLVFGHSRFQIVARHVSEYRTLVELIERQAIHSASHRDDLRHYLENRRDQFMHEDEVPPFLDYRNWFDYSFKLENVESTSCASLGSEDMVRGSFGAQTTHNYLLLLAQSALLFDRCQAGLRLLMMDDAFYGLDPQRKELLLRCGKQLGLDFVIATPDLDGTIQEHAADSTTLLVESDGRGGISVMPFVWERLPLQPDLFSDPRPEAILGMNEPIQ